MNSKEINHFKGLLMRQKLDFENTIEKMKENKQAEQDKYSPTELSNYDNHPADTGTEVFQVEHNNALRVHEEYQLYEVGIALEKIEKGRYGICEFCGNEIDRQRLEALPYTRLCIKCADTRSKETDTVRHGRPVEELVIGSSFGRKYLNKQEDDEHEGLDYLNDLMKYGSASTPQDMGGYDDYDDFYTNEVDKQGIVDKMDNISNEQYKKQLP